MVERGMDSWLVQEKGAGFFYHAGGSKDVVQQLALRKQVPHGRHACALVSLPCHPYKSIS